MLLRTGSPLRLPGHLCQLLVRVLITVVTQQHVFYVHLCPGRFPPAAHFRNRRYPVCCTHLWQQRDNWDVHPKVCLTLAPYVPMLDVGCLIWQETQRCHRSLWKQSSPVWLEVSHSSWLLHARPDWIYKRWTGGLLSGGCPHILTSASMHVRAIRAVCQFQPHSILCILCVRLQQSFFYQSIQFLFLPSTCRLDIPGSPLVFYLDWSTGTTLWGSSCHRMCLISSVWLQNLKFNLSSARGTWLGL